MISLRLLWYSSADLKKSIYAIFSQFGKIVDVVALKTYRLRGQAWVVFADQKSADDAIRSMQGFPFFEKPIVRHPRTALLVCLNVTCCAHD